MDGQKKLSLEFLRKNRASGTAPFPRLPLVEFGVGALSFTDKTVLPCGTGVARSRVRARSRGAQESRSKTGHSKTDSHVKIQSETMTFISVLHSKDKDK